MGVRTDQPIDPALLSPEPLAPYQTRVLVKAVERIPEPLRARQLWCNLPPPIHRLRTLADLIEDQPTSVIWRIDAKTKQLLAMMSPTNLAKVTAAMRAGRRMVGRGYRRTRLDEQDRKVQRAEVRSDDVSGCLRTPAHITPLRRREWVVYAKRPFAGPEVVLAYLARYTDCVAIYSCCLVGLDERSVAFCYKDYRRDRPERRKCMTLDPAESSGGS